MSTKECDRFLWKRFGIVYPLFWKRFQTAFQTQFFHRTFQTISKIDSRANPFFFFERIVLKVFPNRVASISNGGIPDA